jgi:hypothetical protein
MSCWWLAPIRQNDLSEVRQSWSSTLIGAPLQLALAALQLKCCEALLCRTGLGRADENLQRVFPQQWPASVEVDGPQGTTAKEVLVGRGDPADRLTEGDLVGRRRPRSMQGSPSGWWPFDA